MARHTVCALLFLAGLALPDPLPAQSPWTVTLAPAMNPLPLGFCSAVSLSLFDPARKDFPRTPRGLRVGITDFDLAIASPGQAFIGRYNGPAAWFVCACQSSPVGTSGVITATYPAAALDPKARIPGVAFQVQAAITSAAPKGTSNPPECAAATPAPTIQVPSVLAPQRTAVPAPAGVTVTGTPASATLGWQPVTGAVSYTVTRTQASAPAVQQTLAQTSTGMQDVGLRPATAYTYVVGATQADGRGASTSVPFTTPAAVNPAGFAAAQTGAGQVQLTWQPVSAASYYVVFGPGSVSGGMKVTGAASFTVTGVPAGLQTWTVASYYDPGPVPASNAVGPNAVSTPATAFPAASLTVVTAPAPAPAPPTAPAPGSATARLTSFDPAKHGFRFHNDFQNSFIGPPVNLTTGGLCGGMSYAALDYFNTPKAVPTQDYRPANSTTIQSYLYGRQVGSLVMNLDKWAEYSVNPFGSRTTEFFNWGLNERFAELKSFIDRGIPVPLGLRGEAGMSHDHQVVAYGYDAGRYQGSLGPFQQDLKIFVYDPNMPGMSMTLVPDLAAKEFFYLERTHDRWRSYFVDGRYTMRPPPTIVTPVYPADGLTHELRIEFVTGVDDMRGGADHVDVTVRLSDNTTQFFPNVSQNGRWMPAYLETAQIVLLHPVAAASIRQIEIVTNAGGGVGGDNWDLKSVQVIAVGGGFTRGLLTNRAGPYRFTGARIPFVVDVK